MCRIENCKASWLPAFVVSGHGISASWGSGGRLRWSEVSGHTIEPEVESERCRKLS